MFVYQLSGSGFESRCCHLNLRTKGIESHCLKQNILQRKQYQENEKKNKQQQLQKTKNNKTAMPMLGQLIHIKKIKGKLANIAQ